MPSNTGSSEDLDPNLIILSVCILISLDSILILSFENNPTDLPALIKTLSVSASITILSEFRIAWGWLYCDGVIGGDEYEIKGIPFSVSKLKFGIAWYDVK